MILDICFKDAEPKQYRHVRMTTVYTEPSQAVGPELVIHFYHAMYPQVNIPLKRITSVVFTND